VCQTNKVIEIADRLERIEAPGLIARKLFVKIFKSQDVSRGLSSVVCPHSESNRSVRDKIPTRDLINSIVLSTCCSMYS
jgi:hypothetical protein